MILSDGKSSKIIVTLGVLHGLHQGSILSVYDVDKKIGTVIVDTTLDVISYVRPIEDEMTIYKNEYYKVLIEE